MSLRLRRVLARLAVAASLAVALAACAAEDPPGRRADLATAASTDLVLPSAASPSGAPAASSSVQRPGIEPGAGAKIASIAMRTWIYVAPNDRATKLGYLRAGAVVDRGEESAGTDGCAGGWYRIEPRGYVCVGKGASLALDHQVVEAALRGPDRKAFLPYTYVTSKSPPPHLYFRLPTREDQLRVEGPSLGAHLAGWGPGELGGAPLDPVPKFLAEGRDLPKPYGAEEKLHYSVHTGRAREASAFGLVTTFDWTGRRFGLTTELDLIPLDRTKAAHPSQHHGVATNGEGTPAIVVQHGAVKYVSEGKSFRQSGELAYRTGVVLTGKNNGSDQGLLETTDGFWVARETLLLPEPPGDPNGFAASGKKWIDVSIRKQMLVAFEGKKAVFATLVSTGIGGMGDPKETHATARGIFYIHAKHVSATMDGDEATDSYDLRDVPYIQYFFEGYALHGAFWHDDFGRPRSHGCVNLAPLDAAWLFQWTDPVVPPEWHGAVNADGGTLVWVHG